MHCLVGRTYTPTKYRWFDCIVYILGFGGYVCTNGWRISRTKITPRGRPPLFTIGSLPYFPHTFDHQPMSFDRCKPPTPADLRPRRRNSDARRIATASISFIFRWTTLFQRRCTRTSKLSCSPNPDPFPSTNTQCGTLDKPSSCLLLPDHSPRPQEPSPTSHLTCDRSVGLRADGKSFPPSLRART